ncbi:hypothetical protein WK32_17365 [Burkholderia vietnamiensis]|nr:hypothetical protein WK32_17365 [Burkholderia vietnamiensis]
MRSAGWRRCASAAGWAWRSRWSARKRVSAIRRSSMEAAQPAPRAHEAAASRAIRCQQQA